ncbi:MAG TPA: hypothetical protein PLA57_00015 [Candidatus Paceibacterota bacterium]|jgi:hypothetical protein|nr:hypothetical protein [Candidatus Paceibacterota bacterium]HRS47857.1 hypothetical protein [Candidatus Paceibacterota bacterium]
MNKNKFIIIALLIFITLPEISAGQTTNYAVIFDWKTNTYSPLDYGLKIRQPIVAGSEIEIWTNLFKTTISKNQLLYTPQNSENFYYQWFSNGIKFKEGMGLSKITYSLDRYIKISNFSMGVKVYNDTQLIADQTINFKLTSPQVVVYEIKNETSKIAAKVIEASKNEQLRFKAVPYNFTVSSQDLLNFSWYHDNKKIDNDSEILEIKLPNTKTSGFFSVTVRNSKTSLEKASYTFQVNTK